MRASRAIHFLRQRVSRPSTIFPSISRNQYCSSCDARQTPAPRAIASVLTPTPPADHRQLATDQGLFTTSIYSPGSPLFLPHGTRIFNRLTAFLRGQYEYFGFDEVITPTIYKKSLWEKSGHWENYAKDMFSVQGRGATGQIEEKQIGENEEYGLKPMNCPGHCLLFASKKRSYRELPIRYADFSPLHRNEISGALSGLTRVRRFHQDDGHIFCRPSQVGEEITKTLEFVKMAYRVFHLGPYRLALSTRPKDHFIGTEEEWTRAEDALRAALESSGQPWTINEGDGAFYGPKIDIILKDSDGKEHQTATIQLDFQLPSRFELSYVAPAPELEQKGEATTDADLLAQVGEVRPVMIHRAILGSVERFMALLIEHYNGHWPFWINPRQVAIITVSDSKEIVDYANSVSKQLRQVAETPNSSFLPQEFLPAYGRGLNDTNRVFVDVNDTPVTVGKKIRQAKQSRYSILVIVGPKELAAGTLNVDFSALKTSSRDVDEETLLKEMNRIVRKASGEDASLIPLQPQSFSYSLTATQLDNVLKQLGHQFL